jgi:hypothetical protein
MLLRAGNANLRKCKDMTNLNRVVFPLGHIASLSHFFIIVFSFCFIVTFLVEAVKAMMQQC